MLQPKPSFVEQISANGNQGISSLSHSRGAPQFPAQELEAAISGRKREFLNLDGENSLLNSLRQGSAIRRWPPQSTPLL